MKLAVMFALFLQIPALAADLCAPPPGSVAPKLPAHLMQGMGDIHFAITTTSPEAQKFFDQGLNQMHSFWAMEAERSFLQAAALDPAAPMPQWGVAMVASGDYRPRHQLERDGNETTPKWKPGSTVGAARVFNAAQKAMELRANGSDVERMYIDAIWARRDPAVKNHNEAYIAGLRKIMAAHPEQVEAGTFLALHLMRGFVLPERTPREGTMEAVELLRTLVKQFPDHAGVHHYIIHGFEGATFASEAWPSCVRYPQLVTNIPHALHMPGHIWAQTGKWKEGATSFEEAAANEISYMKADTLYGTGHHGHNVEFLITTYGFQGRFADAMEKSADLMAFGENPREKAAVDNTYAVYRQGWFGAMRTLVTFEKWDEILDGKSLPVYDKPREQAWRHWAVGLALANKGASAMARREARSMNEAIEQLVAKAPLKEVPPVLETARKELEGQIALSEHKTNKGLKLMQTAGAMERALRYTEPPAYPRPVLDALGSRALAAGKLSIAEIAFQDALAQTPGNPRAREGLTVLANRKSASGAF